MFSREEYQLKIRTLAVILVGAIVLTGCTNTPKLAGSAVIVNDKAITSAQVSERVDKARTQIQSTDPALIKEVPSLIQLNQRTVDHFILVSLISELVLREGIKITANDVTKYREEVFAQ